MLTLATGAAVLVASVWAALLVDVEGSGARLQTIRIGLVVEWGLVGAAVALRLFVGWPRPLAEITTAVTVLVPSSFVPCLFQRLLGHVDKLLGQAVSLTGLTGVVVTVYLVVVLGLGRSPDDHERTILLLATAS